MVIGEMETGLIPLYLAMNYRGCRTLPRGKSTEGRPRQCLTTRNGGRAPQSNYRDNKSSRILVGKTAFFPANTENKEIDGSSIETTTATNSFMLAISFWLAIALILGFIGYRGYLYIANTPKAKKAFYEVHVLINPQDPENHTRLRAWHATNKEQLLKMGFLNSRIMATRTSVGVYPIQPMITCLVNVRDHKESQQRTDELAKIVNQALTSNADNLVQRSKSEKIVPDNLVQRSKSEKIVQPDTSHLLAQSVSDYRYFESHMKIKGIHIDGKIQTINTIALWIQLAKLCRSAAWTDRKISVVLLSNFDSAKGPYPVSTLRMYDTNLKTFLHEDYKFAQFLRENGYEVIGHHVEEGTYDDNPFTDLDWAIFPISSQSQDEHSRGKPFNQCFRWCRPEDITDEACTPPEGWLQRVTDFEMSI